jgi:hypothetical protein
MAQASWIAIKGADLGAVLQRLGLTQTGQVDYRGDADLACAETPGWVVVMSQAFDYLDGKQAAFTAEVVTGQCWDTIMYSEARGYAAGAEIWSVVHDPDAGPDNLAIEGAPPAELAAIRERLVRAQAERGADQVDYIYEIPIGVAAALCGYGPEAGVAPGTVLRVVEPARPGKAGERQAEQRSLREALGKRVATELFPIAEKLGFRRGVDQPDVEPFYRFGASHVMVRRRGEWSESLDIVYDLRDGAPRVGLEFFVRRGDAPRYGRSGVAFIPPPPLTLMERFKGRKPAQPEDISKALDDGRDLVAAVDLHLREGASHPHIRPAVYWDEGETSNPLSTR